MTTQFNNLYQQVRDSQGHPSLLINAVTNFMETQSKGGMTLVDPNNSVAILTEAMAAMGSGILSASIIETHKLYKTSARNNLDLYRHMSDYDYLNRFPRPAKDTIFRIILDVNTLKNRAKLIPGSGGRKKITIPAHTSIEVNETIFTTEYPIDIFILPHGGISVLQDTNYLNDIKNISTNRIEYQVINIEDGGKYLIINLPMDQYAINRKIISISSLNSFKQEFSYSDKYFHCRAYMRNNDGNWKEIRTTHQDIVFDPVEPTVCLRVLNDSVIALIPQIYFNNRTIGTDIRLDFYTTKGPIEMDLSKLDATNFKMTWKEIDDPNISTYVAPLKDFQGILINSEAKVSGGYEGVGFAELRQRILGRNKEREEPLHEKNLPIKTSLLDYDIVLKQDYLTSRKFVATRMMDRPTTNDTVTGMDLTIQPLLTRLSDLLESRSTKLTNNKIILKPNMLFKIENGTLSVVRDEQIAELLNPAINPPEKLMTNVNAEKFLYSPFHYIIDISSGTPTTRAYVMDKPKIEYIDFIQDNDTVGININSVQKDIWLNSNGNGYVIGILLDNNNIPNDMLADNIGIQMSHPIPGSNRRVYYDGHLTIPNRDDIIINAVDPKTRKPVDNRWLYYFFINTDMDVDVHQNMTVNGFGGALNILSDIDIVYYTKNYRNHDFKPSEIDNLLKPGYLLNYDRTAVYCGITHERAKVRFGTHLEHLWNRMRTIKDTEELMVYENDVLHYYEENVYELDPVTKNPVLVYDDASKTYKRNLLHSVGDIMRDINGNPMIKHRAGEYILDENNKSMSTGNLLSPIQEIDLFLADGKYYFANDETTINYKDDVINKLIGWIKEVGSLAEKFYANTELLFYPKRNIGHVRVIVGNKIHTSIPAEQNLKITYYVPRTVYENTELKDSIETRTASVIDNVLKNNIISKTDISKALRETFVDHVLQVGIDGLFNNEYDVVTIYDDSIRPTIAKMLKLTRSQTLMVVDSIEVVFELHTRT